MTEHDNDPPAGRSDARTGERRHRAGLLDIRSIIAMLIAVYGFILVLAGFFTSDEQLRRADGVNINIWAGLGMLVAAAGFGLWARLRPTEVRAEDADSEQGD